MSFRERLSDRVDLFSKYWKITCEMSYGSMTGGYYDQCMLDRISVAIGEYEQAKVAYREKWSKRTG